MCVAAAALSDSFCLLRAESVTLPCLTLSLLQRSLIAITKGIEGNPYVVPVSII